MTQKQLIKTYLESFDSELLKKAFLFELLQDINWHTEAKQIWESLSIYDRELLEVLTEIDILANPGGYSKRYYHKLKNEASKDIAFAVLEYLNNEDFRVAHIKRGQQYLSITQSQISDYRRVQSAYRVFSSIFGYGLDTSDWESTQGPEFVAELLELL